MSFAKNFSQFIRKGLHIIKNPTTRFEFPRKNSTFPFVYIGYALVASSYAWVSYGIILDTGKGKKAYQNPTQMLELATLDETSTDVSGLILGRDALPALCEIVHSGIASMGSRLKALIILVETSQYNKKVRRYLIDSGELARLLDSLETPCNMVVLKVMLLQHLCKEEDGFRMIWSNPKFVKEIFPCLLVSNLNNLRFRQLNQTQQLSMVRAQLSEVQEVFRKHSGQPDQQKKKTGRQDKKPHHKTKEIGIPLIFMAEVLPAVLTEMAADASKHKGLAMTMAQNNFVDILKSHLINADPWYKVLFNYEHLEDSLDNAKSTLKNLSVECYRQRGAWPEDTPLPTIPHPLTVNVPATHKNPADLVAELKDAGQMRRSWVLIYNDNIPGVQVVVDGTDEAVRRMIPHVHKVGLRAVPALDALDRDELVRAEKLMDVPVVDWEVMRTHLPAPWRRDYYSPALPSGVQVLQVVGPFAIGLCYGAVRSYVGMRSKYAGSPTFNAMSPRWCASVALRCGARTGLAVVLMGMAPEVCRWITCHTQKYFDNPRDVVACSVAQGVAVVGGGAYFLRNCHYWFFPFLFTMMTPKMVVKDLVEKIRD